MHTKPDRDEAAHEAAQEASNQYQEGVITQKELTKQLRRLERFGLVELAERLQTKARESIRVQRSGPA